MIPASSSRQQLLQALAVIIGGLIENQVADALAAKAKAKRRTKKKAKKKR